MYVPLNKYITDPMCGTAEQFYEILLTKNLTSIMRATVTHIIAAFSIAYFGAWNIKFLKRREKRRKLGDQNMVFKALKVSISLISLFCL